ncbi:PucR family transcriptional regulator [Gordonia sp. TBRC 11910]|uniref:PucR family transcriptional regulator n=1 Tax=Gordonia asplenii TaxID=2725283 RepID=A0A848KSH1_9ACTN|nr:PucR family transcriptional regulator ligand-binding domain-containing protein [Gordonia asplenii]NMO00937.1 PucR family transcriptional regulator [Gordonia asplenii]
MISVDQLVAVPSLGLRYLAGERGGSRLVTWAHACDLPDPWSWFDSGDLVMTTCGGLPDGEDDQRRWITSLIDSAVAGLVVAPGQSAPAITPGMLDVARDRGFPVLAAGYDLQFVTLARTVIESAIESERQRVAAIKRLYDTYWQSLHRRATLAERLSALERSTGWSLRVVDLSSGESIALGRKAFEGDVDDVEVQVELPGAAGTALIAGVDAGEPTDRPLLEHVGGLIALELEHAAEQRDRMRESGRALLNGLLDESITLSAVWPEFGLRSMTGELVVACFSAPDRQPLDHTSIHHLRCLQNVAPLLSVRDGELIAIVPNDTETLRRVACALAPSCGVGLSAVLALNSQVPEAFRQAHLAVAQANERGCTVAAYGEVAVRADFLPTSVEDTRHLVRNILGPLIRHDADAGAELVRSVRVFLDNDGGWQRAADALGVHRQTLVYRLKKVEQLTGLKPTSTQGSALLWLALTAADRAGLDLAEHSRPDVPRE